MDEISVIEFYRSEIHFGFYITLLVTLIYGIFAPWYRTHAGRSIFSLLATLAAVLLNAVIRMTWPEAEWTLFLGAFLFGLLNLAVIYVGINIFSSQILRFYKHRKANHELPPRRDNVQFTELHTGESGSAGISSPSDD